MIEQGLLDAAKVVVDAEFQLVVNDASVRRPYNHYLNNFCNIFCEEIGLPSRQTYRDLGFWQMTFREFSPTMAYGDKLLDQTPEEFFAVVDEAASLENADRLEVEELRARAVKISNEGQVSEYSRLMEELNEKIMPVYIRLRAIGYEHYPDLTA